MKVKMRFGLHTAHTHMDSHRVPKTWAERALDYTDRLVRLHLLRIFSSWLAADKKTKTERERKPLRESTVVRKIMLESSWEINIVLNLFLFCFPVLWIFLVITQMCDNTRMRENKMTAWPLIAQSNDNISASKEFNCCAWTKHTSCFCFGFLFAFMCVI